MNDFAPWPWHRSLGAVDPPGGTSYEVRKILFGVVEKHCSNLGLREGDTIRCRKRDHDGVEVELSSGHVRKVDLTYSWFVELEPTTTEPVTDAVG